MADQGEKEVPETWVEWGVRRTRGAIGTVAHMDRRSAEQCAIAWPGELVSRTVTAQPWKKEAHRG